MKIYFAENLRKQRKKNGYRSAADLCAALAAHGYSCSVSTVKAWELGTRQPTFFALAVLCEVLDVTADELIFKTD